MPRVPITEEQRTELRDLAIDMLASNVNEYRAGSCYAVKSALFLMSIDIPTLNVHSMTVDYLIHSKARVSFGFADIFKHHWEEYSEEKKLSVRKERVEAWVNELKELTLRS